jgi:hypothetical protein
VPAVGERGTSSGARNMAQARPPRARRVEMRTWTAEQVGTFLASVRQDRLYAAWFG